MDEKMLRLINIEMKVMLKDSKIKLNTNIQSKTTIKRGKEKVNGSPKIQER